MNRFSAPAAAPHAASVANYCDRAERNEHVEADWVVGAGAALERLALELAAASDVDLIEGVRRAARGHRGSPTRPGFRSNVSPRALVIAPEVC